MDDHDDDDDFYGGAGGPQHHDEPPNGGGQQLNDEQMNDDDDDDDEEEEDDDDDVQFTLERPEGAKPEPTTRPPIKPTPSHDRTASQDPKPKPSTPSIKPETPRTSSVAPTTTTTITTKGGTLTHNGKQGKDFPAHRTSTLDFSRIPTWPDPRKPLTDLDIDADLAENSKPWRLPGTDITDFFNYGFDEYNWALYCGEQRTMASEIVRIKERDATFKNIMGAARARAGPG
ncbi:Fip1 motif, partial [Teratosphaeria destructans]